MTRIGIIVLDYHGKPLATLVLPGRRMAWPVHHIGRALGLGSQGRGLQPRIRREWSGAFTQGRDYLVLSGDVLAAVKASQTAACPVVPADASRLMILLRPGLEKVLERASPLASAVLRGFIREQFDRAPAAPATERPRQETGSTLSQLSQRIAALGARASAFRRNREERLDQQAETRAGQLGLADRRYRVDAIRRLIEIIAGELVLDPEVRLALEVEACAVATEDRVVMLGARDPRRAAGKGKAGDGPSREQLQLDAMLLHGDCPLVLAWEPDGRLGAFRYFPGLREPAPAVAPEQPEAA